MIESLHQSLLLQSSYFFSQVLDHNLARGSISCLLHWVKKLKNTPLYIKPQLTSKSETCIINLLVGVRNDPRKRIDNIIVKFHLPSCVASADLNANYGTVNVLADKTYSWDIGKMLKDKSPCLTGNLSLETGMEHLHVFPVFRAEFKIIGIALSGLQIDKLGLGNLTGCSYKGFRALTRSGGYEVRS